MRFLVVIFLIVSSYSKTMSASYEAKYGIFGTIAKSDAIIDINQSGYRIFTTSKTLGLAATLSNDMVQEYVSVGKVKNGILIPDYYIAIRKKGENEYKRVYEFDHKNRKITRYKYKNGKMYDKYTLKYYVNEDVLTLYFNLQKYLKNRKPKTFYALGGRKEDGRVDVTFPKGEELEKIKKEFDSAKGLYIKANLYNKVFAGDKGILYLVIDEKNWVTLRGMVKNVLKIGDLKGKITGFKLIP